MGEQMAYIGVRPVTRLSDVYCGMGVPAAMRVRVLDGMTVLWLPVTEARSLLGEVISEELIQRYLAKRTGYEGWAAW